jgi:hypothetical protein
MRAIFGRAYGREFASHPVYQEALARPRIPDTEHFINVDRRRRQALSFAAAKRGTQRAWMAHPEGKILDYVTEPLRPAHG